MYQINITCLNNTGDFKVRYCNTTSWTFGENLTAGYTYNWTVCALKYSAVRTLFHASFLIFGQALGRIYHGEHSIGAMFHVCAGVAPGAPILLTTNSSFYSVIFKFLTVFQSNKSFEPELE